MKRKICALNSWLPANITLRLLTQIKNSTIVECVCVVVAFHHLVCHLPLPATAHSNTLSIRSIFLSSSILYCCEHVFLRTLCSQFSLYWCWCASICCEHFRIDTLFSYFQWNCQAMPCISDEKKKCEKCEILCIYCSIHASVSSGLDIVMRIKMAEVTDIIAIGAWIDKT